MASVGDGPTPLDLSLVEQEIGVLDKLAFQHPGKAMKLANLISEWLAFQQRMRGSLH